MKVFFRNSILRQSGMCGVADEAVLIAVHKIKAHIVCFKNKKI